jgi:hypothetical protein
LCRVGSGGVETARMMDMSVHPPVSKQNRCRTGYSGPYGGGTLLCRVGSGGVYTARVMDMSVHPPVGKRTCAATVTVFFIESLNRLRPIAFPK